MDAQTARRIAPIVFAIAVVAAVLLDSSAVVPVCIVGGMLLGVLYVATASRVKRPRDRGRG